MQRIMKSRRLESYEMLRKIENDFKRDITVFAGKKAFYNRKSLLDGFQSGCLPVVTEKCGKYV